MGWWNSGEGGIIGDSVVEIMMDAMGKIEKEYQEEFDRKPNSEELIAVIGFATSSFTKQMKREAI